MSQENDQGYQPAVGDVHSLSVSCLSIVRYLSFPSHIRLWDIPTTATSELSLSCQSTQLLSGDQAQGKLDACRAAEAAAEEEYQRFELLVCCNLRALG